MDNVYEFLANSSEPHLNHKENEIILVLVLFLYYQTDSNLKALLDKQ